MVWMINPAHAAKTPIRESVRQALANHHARANISIEEIEKENQINQAQSSQVVYDPGGGAAIVRVQTDGTPLDLRVRYSAHMRIPLAVRKIQPMEKLVESDFRFETVDVSKGMYPSLRGLVVEHLDGILQHETKQTILPGQPPLTNGLQRIADVRRGDVLQLRMLGQGVSIQATAQAEEQGHLGQSIRVLIQRTKKPMQAKIIDAKTVEVQL